MILVTKGIGAQTMTSHTMNDVKTQVEKALETTNPADILVAFDIDMTLIQSTHPATAYPTIKKHGSIYKKIFGNLPSAVKDITLNLPAQFPSKLVEQETPQIIQDLQTKGVKVVALTAALTGYLRQVFGEARIEELRHRALHGLGINFENTFDFKEVTFKTIPPYRNNHPTFFKGLLFSNGEQGAHNKGTVLTTFLKHANFTPKVVIFVDDRKKNLEQVELALKEHYSDTKFLGIEYLGAFKSSTEEISESDFHAFWHGLVERAKSLR
jgi:hypothetical protein